MSGSQLRSKAKIHWAKLFKYPTEVLSSVIWLLLLCYLQSLALEANSSLRLKIHFDYAVSWLSCPAACPPCCLTATKKNNQILKINRHRKVNDGSFSPYFSCHLSFKEFSTEAECSTTGHLLRIQVKSCADTTANKVPYFGIIKCYKFAVLKAQKPV